MKKAVDPEEQLKKERKKREKEERRQEIKVRGILILFNIDLKKKFNRYWEHDS